MHFRKKTCSSNTTSEVQKNSHKLKKTVLWEYSKQAISKRNIAVQSLLDFSKLQKNVQNLRRLIRKSEKKDSDHS